MSFRNKYIALLFTLSIEFSCINKDTQPLNIVEFVENNKIKNYKEWLFYTVSESPLVNTNTKTRGEIIDEFKKVKIEINNTYFTVENLCSFELYKTNKTSLEYWHTQATRNIFSQELSQKGVALTDSLIIYQALYPEKSCKNPASEYFITDSTLVFSYNGYLILFQQQPKLDLSTKGLNNKCYSNTKITNLPLAKEKLSAQRWNELSCSISNLNSNMYIRLPDIENVLVFVIADFNGDDEFYTLITMKNDKIITQKEIGFADDIHDDGRSVTEFEINKDYVFTLKTNERKNGVWQTIEIGKYKIDKDGVFSMIE